MRKDRLREHTSVLLNEAVEFLKVRPGEKYIDATVGFGGHALEIAKKGGAVLGIERDPETIRELKTEKLKIVKGNFADLKRIARRNGFERVAGVLFDLGLSSWQIEKSGRGFSYQGDERLDMRLSLNGEEPTASQIINRVDLKGLKEIFEKFGEENQAGQIAAAIVQTRPIETTGRLREVIGQAGGSQKTVVKIFQALRMAVNDELENLEQGLDQAIELLKPGGRLVVISFHSLEDRIIKLKMKNGQLKMVTSKPVTASTEEVWGNPRARSAKLRAGEKL